MPSHAPRTTAKKIVSVAATLVSALLHAGLGTLGISIAIAASDSWFVRIFGAALGACVLGSLVVLALAWRSRSPGLRTTAAMLAAILVVIWTAGSLDNGILSGLELYACIAIAMVAGLNWFAVRAITEP